MTLLSIEGRAYWCSAFKMFKSFKLFQPHRLFSSATRGGGRTGFERLELLERIERLRKQRPVATFLHACFSIALMRNYPG
jgi:hypothetical protein